MLLRILLPFNAMGMDFARLGVVMTIWCEMPQDFAIIQCEINK